MTNLNAIYPYITIENAIKYQAQTDKFLWIEYSILDEVEIRATDAMVNWVEDRFEELLEKAGIKA